MTSTILRFAISSALSLAAVVSAHAQVSYTSRPGGGNWSDPNTWTVSGNGPAAPAN